MGTLVQFSLAKPGAGVKAQESQGRISDCPTVTTLPLWHWHWTNNVSLVRPFSFSTELFHLLIATEGPVTDMLKSSEVSPDKSLVNILNSHTIVSIVYYSFKLKFVMNVV